MATNRKRYIISVTDRMYQDIENYKNEHHIATYSGAIQEILSIGLATLKQEQAEKELTKKLEVRRTSGRHYILRKE